MDRIPGVYLILEGPHGEIDIFLGNHGLLEFQEFVHRDYRLTVRLIRDLLSKARRPIDPLSFRDIVWAQGGHPA